MESKTSRRFVSLDTNFERAEFISARTDTYFNNIVFGFYNGPSVFIHYLSNSVVRVYNNSWSKGFANLPKFNLPIFFYFFSVFAEWISNGGGYIYGCANIGGSSLRFLG